MTRAFARTPIPAEVLARVLGAAGRAPSAGNAQGTDLIVLEGHDETARYWDISLPVQRRATFAWPRLLDAPVLVVPLANADAYLSRYSEDDKVASGLGEGEDRWPVSYWQIDTAFAAMLVMLAAVDEGLGSLFFGIFSQEAELMEQLGVPASHKPIGTIALGYAAEDDRASRSSKRPRRSFDDVVHRGRW